MNWINIVYSVVSLGGLALVFGFFLTVASKKFYVKVDPKIEQISEILPNANCGACGYPGCDNFAKAVVEGKAPANGCVVGGQETADKISEILGIESASVTPMIAVVQCLGDREIAVRRSEYYGVSSCKEAEILGGDKGCEYGCLGFGDCVEACPFEAMRMGENGLPIVIEERCTGCGECVKACPRGIMALVPENQKIYLGCISKERGKDVSSVCKLGCIGCTLCTRVVPEGTITMDGYIPIIHYDKIKNWDEIQPVIDKCPTKTFVVREV